MSVDTSAQSVTGDQAGHPDAPPLAWTESRAARGWLDRSWALVHPWGSGGVYPNFPDPDLPDWGATTQ